MVQSNLWQTRDALKSFLVPPSSALPTAHVLDISLIHADVFQVCRSRKFELIATAWFLDTQPNILAAVDKFFACLKPGGHWVNVGPLKYHKGTGKEPKSHRKGTERGPHWDRNMATIGPQWES